MSAVILPSEPHAPTPPKQGWRSRAIARVSAALDAESDRFVLWLPALLGLGIGIYFALPSQAPLVLVFALVAIAVAIGFALPPRQRRIALPAFAAFGLGIGAAALRTEHVAAPIVAHDLGVRHVEGTVRWFEPLEAPGRLRLILDRPVIEGLQPEQSPVRMRLRLAGVQAEPRVGDRIALYAKISPPPGEVAPGGYDFARVAWFERLGAVGFGGKFELIAHAEQNSRGLSRLFASLRAEIQRRIWAALPERQAAFATALITGARAGIPHADLLDMQKSGLLHILSISGFHLALVAGLVMAAVRGGLAFIEPIALYWPLKKIAAALALLVSAFYVGISGGDVATWRSFVMLAVAMGAILIDRPALTMRSVALAAGFILLLMPESLFNPSFQMSFGAVAAIIAGYEWLRTRPRGEQPRAGIFQRYARWLLLALGTTLLAELATAPFAAYHFNQLVLAGFFSNEIADLLFGLYIMPFAIVSVLAMPFGLEEWPLRLMGFGLDQCLNLTHWFAALNIAGVPLTYYFKAWPLAALLCVVFGGVWIILWRTRLRYLGALFFTAGILVAALTPGADLIADESGHFAFRVKGDAGWQYGLVGVRSTGFKGQSWIRRLGGDPAIEARAQKFMHCDALGCAVDAGRGGMFSLVRDGRALEEECATHGAILSLVAATKFCASGAMVLDSQRLRREGPIALRLADNGSWQVMATRSQSIWPWHPQIAPRTLPPITAVEYPEDDSDD